jgi:hypothetical protein
MSTFERLDMATFERLLEVHGSNIMRWPEASRDPLQRLLDSSDVARARWADAASFDALLAASPDVEPAPDLMARIASLPARHPRPERVGWWPFGNPLPALLGWGTAAALGVLMGVAEAPDFGEADADTVDAVALVEDDGADADGADEWTEVSELVMGAQWASEDE